MIGKVFRWESNTVNHLKKAKQEKINTGQEQKMRISPSHSSPRPLTRAQTARSRTEPPSYRRQFSFSREERTYSCDYTLEAWELTPKRQVYTPSQEPLEVSTARSWIKLSIGREDKRAVRQLVLFSTQRVGLNLFSFSLSPNNGLCNVLQGLLSSETFIILLEEMGCVAISPT